MKKNELLHLHALLVAVAADFSERELVDRDDIATYHALDVTPLSLQAPRDSHEEAVLTLSELLADRVRQTPRDEAATAGRTVLS